MGQQQLLLLVLGVVIVGIAVAVGIQAYTANEKKSNLDGLTLQARTIAVEAHAYSKRPDFLQVQKAPTLTQLGYPAPGDTLSIEYGKCTVAGAGNDITAWGVTCDNDGYGHSVTVDGLTDTNEFSASTSINSTSGS